MTGGQANDQAPCRDDPIRSSAEELHDGRTSPDREGSGDVAGHLHGSGRHDCFLLPLQGEGEGP
jgi:hypothetical protein